jgi:hypothetical protein
VKSAAETTLERAILRISHTFLNPVGFLSRDWTAWLTWEDSNFHITGSKKGFEISTEFRANSAKSHSGDFCSQELEKIEKR